MTTSVSDIKTKALNESETINVQIEPAVMNVLHIMSEIGCPIKLDIKKTKSLTNLNKVELVSWSFLGYEDIEISEETINQVLDFHVNRPKNMNFFSFSEYELNYSNSHFIYLSPLGEFIAKQDLIKKCAKQIEKYSNKKTLPLSQKIQQLATFPDYIFSDINFCCDYNNSFWKNISWSDINRYLSATVSMASMYWIYTYCMNFIEVSKYNSEIDEILDFMKSYSYDIDICGTRKTAVSDSEYNFNVDDFEWQYKQASVYKNVSPMWIKKILDLGLYVLIYTTEFDNSARVSISHLGKCLNEINSVHGISDQVGANDINFDENEDGDYSDDDYEEDEDYDDDDGEQNAF